MKTSIKKKLNLVINFLFILIFFSSCSKIEVKDSSLKILPYNENERGKFWEICINYNNIGFSEKPIAYFEVVSKNNRHQTYSIDFIHLKQRCNKQNVLVSFTNRHTSSEEFEWLEKLEPKDVKYIELKIKSDYRKTGFIYKKTFLESDLD
ncbi:MAG: hypothetical protein COA31_003435 [Flavobacteriales bacterium]|nr:hypothetical protein [Flavobacteriales bacterium]